MFCPREEVSVQPRLTPIDVIWPPHTGLVRRTIIPHCTWTLERPSAARTDRPMRASRASKLRQTPEASSCRYHVRSSSFSFSPGDLQYSCTWHTARRRARGVPTAAAPAAVAATHRRFGERERRGVHAASFYDRVEPAPGVPVPVAPVVAEMSHGGFTYSVLTVVLQPTSRRASPPTCDE